MLPLARDSSALLEKSLVCSLAPIILSSLSATVFLVTSSFLLMTSFLGSQCLYQIPSLCWVTSAFVCMSHPTIIPTVPWQLPLQKPWSISTQKNSKSGVNDFPRLNTHVGCHSMLEKTRTPCKRMPPPSCGLQPWVGSQHCPAIFVLLFVNSLASDTSSLEQAYA